jgi:hypothetical protein
MKINSTNPTEDLQVIREIMERSSKFLSLSGLSGIFAGLCAFAGVTVAWFFILDTDQALFIQYIHRPAGSYSSVMGFYLALDAILVLGFALLGAGFFSQRKAVKTGQDIWNNSTKHLLINLMIPLVSGGIFIIILLARNILELVAPAMLIFYGLSLVNAGKFTLGEIHSLGLTEIVLGLLACVFINFGLLFWAVGFGLMHIIYGTIMYYRYDR